MGCEPWVPPGSPRWAPLLSACSGCWRFWRCVAAPSRWPCSTATSTCATPPRWSSSSPAATSPIVSPPTAARSWYRPSRWPKHAWPWPARACPSGGSVGYEIFDRSDGLVATEFQQKINETRALEGEIARTIRAMQGIRGVRVHLVLPRREPFARDRQDAQASVMLTMAGVGRLDREGIQAILNLVSAAVPGLRPQNIAIVDSRGDLLARAGEPVGPTATALSTEEVRHATELRLARAVEEMLERSLGAGHVRAEAAVRMSFDRMNQTEERYDPDGQVTRSSQSVTTNSKNTEAERRGHGAEQPAQRRCRPRGRRLAGGTAGGDHQLRDQQDGAHADPRAAADRAHEPRGDGRWHGQRRRGWQACLAASRGGGTGSHHRPGEERDRLRREARRPRRGGEHALRRPGRRTGGR